MNHPGGDYSSNPKEADEDEEDCLYEELEGLDSDFENSPHFDAKNKMKDVEEENEEDDDPITLPPQSSSVAKSFIEQEKEMRRLNAKLDKDKDQLLRKAEQNLRAVENAKATPSSTTLLKRETSTPPPANASAKFVESSVMTGIRPSSTGRTPSSSAAINNSAMSSSSMSSVSGIRRQSEPAVQSAFGNQVNVSEARIVALEQQLRQMISQLQSNEQTIQTLQSEKQTLATEQGKLNATVAGLTKKVQQEKAINDDLRAKFAETSAAAQGLTTAVAVAQKQQKNTEKGTQETALRLQRAQKEVGAVRSQLEETEGTLTQQLEECRKMIDRLNGENRKLKQQKTELLNAFRKQSKLVDVLKRQKMHVEASRLLAFTEQEFTKSLELGEK